jgi:hypothetical protein
VGEGTRARSVPYPGSINRLNRGTLVGPDHTVPYGTVPVFASIPGNEIAWLRSFSPSGTTPSAPCEHPQPATRAQFGLGAVLQYSNIPSLRVAGSEDSLPDVASRLVRHNLPEFRTTGRRREFQTTGRSREDENEAPGERGKLKSKRRTEYGLGTSP